jgi:hypothetical protein
MISKYLGNIGLLFVVFLILNLSGCFYSFTGASVPSHLHTIAIPVVDDRSGSAEAGLSESFTSALTQKFINDNTLQLAGIANADAVIESTILSFSDVPSVITSGEQITQNKITITVRSVFRDRVLKKVVFDRQFSNNSLYNINDNVFSNRQDAIKAAIDLVSEDILIATVSNW